MVYFNQNEIGNEKAFLYTAEMQRHGTKIKSTFSRVAEIRSTVQRGSFLFTSQSEVQIQNQVQKLGYMIKTIKTSFKKSLGTLNAQVVIEYCLVLVVVAAIMMSFFARDFGSIQQMFNTTTSRIMTRIVASPPPAP